MFLPSGGNIQTTVLFAGYLLSYRPMKLAVFAVFVVCCLAGASCRTSDIRAFDIAVPEMKNEACAQIVGRVLTRQAGIQPKGIVIDLDKRVVRVRYDSMVTAKKNLEFAIAEAGFKANEVPANDTAAKALPQECR